MDKAPAVVIAAAMVWGVTVVADSAQFSAALSELSEPERVGSALALQTADRVSADGAHAPNLFGWLAVGGEQ